MSIIQSEIELHSKKLRSYISKKSLLQACMHRKRSERLYAYHGILRDACSQCFRGTDISPDDKRCRVWSHDGTVWVPVSSGVFRDAVGEALIALAGGDAPDVKGDWIEKQAVMMSSAYTGVCSSPLMENPGIVGFANGVWDFSDVEHPVRHDFSERPPVTSLLPYDYDPDAGCPLWTTFLSTMLRPTDVKKLQKYLGLGVVHRRAMDHVVEDTLWLVGSGGNGKTTIENVVRGVYGYDKVSEASMFELLDRNQISRMLTVASIEGKIFNICSEVDMADMTKGSDTFKRLCSGEPQNARSIGKDVHIAYDIPFLIFSMNRRPKNKRMDNALRRRIVEVRFDVAVRPEDMDASLGRKLMGELSGIRNWMIEGYRKLVKDDFHFTHTSDEEYMEVNEQYFDLFARREGLRPSAWAGHDDMCYLVNATVLYDTYCEFCNRNMFGTETPTQREMAADLDRLNYTKKRKASGIFYLIYSDKPLKYGTKV